MQTRDGRDLPIADMTAENYVVEEKDKGFFHIKIQRKVHDKDRQEYFYRTRIQKFGVKEWGIVQKELLKTQETLFVLYDPTDYLAKKATEKRESKGDSAKQLDALRAELEELKKQIPAAKNPVGRPPANKTAEAETEEV